MDSRHNFLRLLPALLINALFANALFARGVPSQPYPMRVKVVTSQFTPLQTATPVPAGCDLQHYSNACKLSETPSGKSVMVVRDGWGRNFTIWCTTDSKWSNCAPLPVGETFSARREKRGLRIVYRDIEDQEQKQLYEFLLPAASAAQPGAAATLPKATVSETTSSAAIPPEAMPDEVERVKCNFASTPPGAEITLDNQYVGNTPSEIGLKVGTHVVVLDMPGFAQWRRELTVVGNSEVNVTATLLKTQP